MGERQRGECSIAEDMRWLEMGGKKKEREKKRRRRKRRRRKKKKQNKRRKEIYIYKQKSVRVRAEVHTSRLKSDLKDEILSSNLAR